MNEYDMKEYDRKMRYSENPITHEGKVYTQLKPITGEAIYEAQEDKKSECFRKEFNLYVRMYGWHIEEFPVDSGWLVIWRNHPKWLPFLELHGFISIEDFVPLLKDCPHCGGKPTYDFGDLDNTIDCSCGVGLWGKTRQAAIDLWNKRG